MKDLDPELRRQLTEARENICRQLDAIEDRRLYHPRRAGGPPNFDSIESELQGQLNQIDELLGQQDEGI